MIAPIVSAMLKSAEEACAALRESIVNVKPAGFSEDMKFELLTFEVVGDKHRNGRFLGRLDGRNRNLCLGFGEEADKAIAARVLIDDHAVIV